MHIYIYVYIYIDICICAYMHRYIHKHMYARVLIRVDYGLAASIAQGLINCNLAQQPGKLKKACRAEEGTKRPHGSFHKEGSCFGVLI